LKLRGTPTDVDHTDMVAIIS
jgi:hypothetical protein